MVGETAESLGGDIKPVRMGPASWRGLRPPDSNGESSTLEPTAPLSPTQRMYHCHILEHEDQRMMGVLDVVA